MTLFYFKKDLETRYFNVFFRLPREHDKRIYFRKEPERKLYSHIVIWQDIGCHDKLLRDKHFFFQSHSQCSLFRPLYYSNQDYFCIWSIFGKFTSICHKFWYYNPYIFATRCRSHLIFQNIYSARSNSLGLKYKSFTPSGCKDKGIINIEFVAKAQHLFVCFFC